MRDDDLQKREAEQLLWTIPKTPICLKFSDNVGKSFIAFTADKCDEEARAALTFFREPLGALIEYTLTLAHKTNREKGERADGRGGRRELEGVKPGVL